MQYITFNFFFYIRSNLDFGQSYLNKMELEKSGNCGDSNAFHWKKISGI